MKMVIQGVGFTLTTSSYLDIKDKVLKFTTFHDNIVSVSVNLSQVRKCKESHIQIQVPGKTLFTKAQDMSKDHQQSFTTAFDSMVNKLKKQKTFLTDKKLRKKKRSRVHAFAA